MSVSSATVAVNGNLQANFNIGLNAEGSYKQSFEKTLASKLYKPFNITSVLTFQPVIAFIAQLDVDVQSTGTIETKVGVSLPNFGATLDFKDSTKSKAAGFQPAFNTSLVPTGQITASLGVALPITVSAID